MDYHYKIVRIIFLLNVDKLRKASTQAAASIEETAAALKKLQVNMSNNNKNVMQMVLCKWTLQVLQMKVRN